MTRSLIFGIVLSLFSTTAFAGTRTKFVCEASEEDNGIEVQMTFADGGDFSLQSPIFFKFRSIGASNWTTPPSDPYNHMRAAALNAGDAGSFYAGTKKARTVLGKAANDSCVSVDFVLYQTSGYTNGYLKSDNSCDPSGQDKSYSTVQCTVEEL